MKGHRNNPTVPEHLMTTWYAIRARCENPNNGSFYIYGGRSIKNHITPEQLHALWIKDRADQQQHPTIDRIDNDQSYTPTNCHFIEKHLNKARGLTPRKLAALKARRGQQNNRGTAKPLPHRIGRPPGPTLVEILRDMK